MFTLTNKNISTNINSINFVFDPETLPDCGKSWGIFCDFFVQKLFLSLKVNRALKGALEQMKLLIT